jgi:hypothetical protein
METTILESLKSATFANKLSRAPERRGDPF